MFMSSSLGNLECHQRCGTAKVRSDPILSQASKRFIDLRLQHRLHTESKSQACRVCTGLDLPSAATCGCNQGCDSRLAVYVLAASEELGSQQGDANSGVGGKLAFAMANFALLMLEL